jgi:hypothetical protein
MLQEQQAADLGRRLESAQLELQVCNAAAAASAASEARLQQALAVQVRGLMASSPSTLSLG